MAEVPNHPREERKESCGSMGQPRRRTPRLVDGSDPRLVDVGARIAEARRQLGIDQKELAKLVHVSDKAVSLWERGKTSPHRHIRDISAVLGRPEMWFWDGDTLEMETKQILQQLLEVNRRVLDELRLLRLERAEQEIPH